MTGALRHVHRDAAARACAGGLNVGDQVEIVSEPDDSPFGLAVSVVTIEG